MARLTVNKKMRVLRIRYKLEINPGDSLADVLRAVVGVPAAAKLVDSERSDYGGDDRLILWFEVEQETQTSEATECPPTK